MAVGKYDELLEKAFTTITSYVDLEWPVVKQTVQRDKQLYNLMTFTLFMTGTSYCKLDAIQQWDKNVTRNMQRNYDYKCCETVTRG